MYAKNKQKLIELIQGKTAQKPRHIVTNVTIYKTLLREAALQEKFQLAYQLSSKTPQAFVFGSQINNDLKKAINVELSKMNRSGLTEQIEQDWKD